MCSPQQSYQPSVSIFSAGIVNVSWIISVILILLAIPRGFDFSDEGLYLYLANPHLENTKSPVLYDLFFKVLYKISSWELSLIVLRMARFIGTICAFFSLMGVYKAITEKNVPKSLAYPLIGLGLLGSYAFLPPTLSYNNLILFFTCFWLYFLFVKKGLYSILFLIPILLALLYIKPPVGILLVGITLIWYRYQKSQLLRFLLFLLVFGIAWEFVFYVLFEDGLVFRTLKTINQDNLRSTYQLGSLLKSTSVGLYWVLLAFFPFFILSKIQKARAKGHLILSFGALIFLGVISYLTHITEEWNHIFVLILAALLGISLGRIEDVRSFLTERKYLVILLVLPFILHFGSNVYWLRLSIYFMVFWIIALLLIGNLKISYLQNLMAPSLVFLIAVGVWIVPFEQESLWNAKFEWELKGGSSIKLSHSQIELLEKIQAKLASFPDGKILTVYRNPGMLLLLDYPMDYGYGFWEASEWENWSKEQDLPDRVIYYSMDLIPQHILVQYHSEFIEEYQGAAVYLLWKK